MDEEKPLRREHRDRDEPKKPPRMCKTATLLSKICFGLMFIGLLFFMIGFWSPYWSTRELFPPLGRLMVEVRGLWQMCQFTHLFNKCFPGADTDGCRWLVGDS